MIINLKENQILVFGSNLNGYHYGGSAKQAYEDFGAEWGNGFGLQGIGASAKSYAIPTLGFEMEKLPLEHIKKSLETLVEIAGYMPYKEFLLTPIGTGIAGFSLEEIKSILPKLPSNITLVGKWD